MVFWSLTQDFASNLNSLGQKYTGTPAKQKVERGKDQQNRSLKTEGITFYKQGIVAHAFTLST